MPLFKSLTLGSVKPRGILSRRFVFPNGLSDLYLWLKSDIGVTTTPTKVSAWDDQSGNARNTAQGTDGSRPDYATNVVNGYPAVRFGPTSNSYTLPFTSPPSRTPAGTIFAVVRYEIKSSTNFQCLLSVTQPGSHGTIYMGWTTPDNGKIAFYNNGSAAVTGSIDLVDGSPYLLKWRYSNDNNTAAVQVNGTPEVIGGQTTDNVTHEWAALSLAHPTQDCISDILELIVYGRELSEVECAGIRSYVSAKYAIQM